MICKTPAIPIRIAPFGGTSHIVTWFTPEYGKIATVIKGACRPKRAGGGQYDLGYLCELLFYEKESNGLHVFKDCTALDTQSQCRGDWQRTAAISYLCLLAGTGTIERTQVPGLYNLLLAGCTAIRSAASLPRLLLWVDLQILALHGVAPQLEQCTLCHCPPSGQDQLAVRIGGLLCPTCAKARPTPTTPLSSEGWTLLRQLQRLTRPLPPSHPNAIHADGNDAILAIGHFLAFWIDLAPASRAVAYQMISLNL